MRKFIHYVLATLFAALLLFALYQGLFAYSHAALTMHPGAVIELCGYMALGVIAALGASRQMSHLDD